MFNFSCRVGSLILTTLYLSGCTNPPTVTEADIPLVHSSLAYSIAPDTKSVAINIPTYKVSDDTLDTFVITVNGADYIATKQYTSISGQQCIRFVSQKSVINKQQDKRTACQKEGRWVLLKQLVASINSKANN
jgi:hypothetical protein